MSKITEIIQPQFYELIRDRIGEILIDEIANQVTYTNEPVLKCGTYIERVKPFDKTELPAINIKLSEGDYSNKNQGNSEGTYKYFIEVHTNSKTTEVYQGDSAAKVACQRLLGVIRAILENPIYNTLGFLKPSISNTMVQSIEIAEINEPDALNTSMGRLVFSVKVTENTQLKTPVLMSGYETKVKLGTTDKGYYYQG